MKTVNISTLKAKLSATLKMVRAGYSLVILDRDVPVAELRPYREKHPLTVREPIKKFVLPESGVETGNDPLVYLTQDRNKR
ncbi:MAG TPA: hypothetical protein PLI62_02485 [Spirochaetota bacterium]|nr:hypothetical protein [Spirochaetota bacterium]HQP48721.1 hypothetical protein [Spirochaetota bacterium]